MLCSRKQAISAMVNGQDPRKFIVPEKGDTPLMLRCELELIAAIENGYKTFFHYQLGIDDPDEVMRIRNILEELGYRVLSSGGESGNAVLFDGLKGVNS